MSQLDREKPKHDNVMDVTEERIARVYAEAFLGAVSKSPQAADMVAEVVAGSQVTYEGTASPDRRNYRVNCDKIARLLPAFRPRWTVRAGIEQLAAAYRAAGLTEAAFLSSRYFRIGHVKAQLAEGTFGADLMPRPLAA